VREFRIINQAANGAPNLRKWKESEIDTLIQMKTALWQRQDW